MLHGYRYVQGRSARLWEQLREGSSRAIGRVLLLGLWLLAVGPTLALAQTAGLVAAYGFEEASGTAVIDASGSGNAGTITAATRTAAGKFGKGLTFNGTTAYVRIPDAASLDLGATGTVAAWVYQASALNYAGVIHKGQLPSFADEAYSLQFSGTTRRPELYLTNASSRILTATSAGALSLATWHHVAATWDSSGLKIYLNGALNTSSAGTFTPMNSAGALFLGTQTPGQYGFAGTLDEVLVYNRALSLAEIQQAMTRPVGGGTPPDTTPPTVSQVSAPVSPLSGTVTLGATAADNSGIAPSVQFLLNGQPLGTPVAGPSPHALPWNTATVVNGSYQLSARATDGAGLTSTSAPITVTVSNVVPQPVPGISGLSVAAGPVTTVVTIAGAAFGAAQGSSTVTFNGISATATTWSASSITARVPPGATTGPVVVTVGGQASNGVTFTVIVPAPVPVGLVAAYGFEEPSGATVVDTSGKGNAGTLTNATRTTTGRFGRGLVFDGTSAYVRVPDAASLDLGATGTVAAWVFQTTARSYAGLVHKGQVSDFSDEAYSLQFEGTSRRPSLYLSTTTTTRTLAATTAGALSLGTWHHMAATWDSAGIKLYLNGALHQSSAGAFTPQNSAGALFLGAQTPGQYGLAGTLDEVLIYDRALSLSEIQQVMHQPVPLPDTTPPTVSPVSVSVSPLSGLVTLSTTAGDNSGTAPTVQFLLDGVPLGASVPGPPYSISWDTTTVANGPYTLSARATDAANLSATSGPTSVTVSNVDADPPEVHILTPTTGSRVSGTIQVSAEVHHEGDLVAVQFFLDDTTPLGPELAPSATYVVSWSVGALTGSHSITARARDLAGNVGVDTVTVTANAPPAQGLVAAYAFNETFGAGVPDSSGNNKTGTLFGGTWTAGKFGNALSFTGGYVLVPDGASLDVTTAGTVSAWVKQAADLGGAGIIHKGQASDLSDEAFSLQGENGVPSLRLADRAGASVLVATNALPLATWRHVTATWDASVMRLYVDGILTASAPNTRAARNSAGPLIIGSRVPGGFPFAGLIDEVRIYNRALTPEEIVADMNEPLGDGQLPPAGPLAVSPGDVLNTQYFGWDPAYSQRQDGDYAWYSMAMTAGTTYTVTTANASGGTTTDTYLYVLDPLGAVVASDDNSAGGLAARVAYQATTTGTHLVKLRAAVLGAYGYATLAIASGLPPSPAVLPDLVVWQAKLHDVRIVNSNSLKLLNFSSGVANVGPGELIVYGVVQPDGTTFGYQRIRNADGSITDYLAGTFVFPGHGTHTHWHFDNFQNYYLRAAPPEGGVGAILRSSTKVSFCITDSQAYDLSVPNASQFAAHTCNAQGVSVGWGDIYGRTIEGQHIDITGMADGTYWLEVIADPARGLREVSTTNNVGRIKIAIAGNSVSILP